MLFMLSLLARSKTAERNFSMKLPRICLSVIQLASAYLGWIKIVSTSHTHTCVGRHIYDLLYIKQISQVAASAEMLQTIFHGARNKSQRLQA